MNQSDANITAEVVADLRTALKAYFPDETPHVPASTVVGGGFSGARIWRIEASIGPVCVRQWPTDHPTPDRLREIHRVLLSVQNQGLSEVAAPLLTQQGQSWIEVRGRLWELSPWLPGEANFDVTPTPAKLQSALTLLARFHLAASCTGPSRHGPPPGLLARLRQLRVWMEGETRQVESALRGSVDAEIERFARHALTTFARRASQLRRSLEQTSQLDVPLQPCIRDVWHDHVLFTGDRVTGLIDFGAMREDHVASDISRLLGSLVEDQSENWSAGLAAYQSLRPLSATDQILIRAYDETGVLLSAMNWLRWLILERRRFDSQAAVKKRLDHLFRRLSNLNLLSIGGASL